MNVDKIGRNTKRFVSGAIKDFYTGGQPKDPRSKPRWQTYEDGLKRLDSHLKASEKNLTIISVYQHRVIWHELPL